MREPDADAAVVWRNRALTLFDRVSAPVAVCDVYGAVLLANPAMAAECGSTPGRVKGLGVLDLFRPVEAVQVERIAQALRLRHRSRYQVSVRWDAPGGRIRHGELTADPVSDGVGMTPALLVMLRVLGEETPACTAPSEAVTPVEARILALLAGGATTARAARETGLTPDGVSYHLRRLSARWGAANRTELVARAYAEGVLAAGVWPPVGRGV
ncbi:PAS domain-containing protein [Streptomyces acidiscabies]|uniref:PAS domain-containing protein n=3 Tax=Streptomyces acidiscabies TaxID=42234 RepID=A0AAP6B5F3_9ACTN|nr:PAS domain-containing protein [Streptomyces acidiscabies]MBP5941521.1 PAS domain-containing protein [Streptomyces sp. LBUM 1476]MBZ3912906.1 PAS domain-containing protein [Streptomyces acidiscabies]MDX2958390.1 PAS domain-containing protein [Streptomyces acidiscabies]MDX3021104.1 PAS domain-containing protein [Streptomyces acidiscabies]MDX3790940.1 PAS domain-containing protein [Streptomyces acidiscabies]